MISCKILILAFSFLTFKAEESVRPEVSSYIDEYKYLAIDEMVRSGIPASITLAQAILESNAGVSKLARESNNHFGINDYAGATAVAVVMLVISFVLLLVINALQAWQRRSTGAPV